MSGPDLDVTERNAIGGLDRFVLNSALAILSVVPTLIVLIATPWRMAFFLTNDEPDGRRGMLLAPGVFFVASITVTMLAAGLLATPETIEVNTGLIGPAYSKNVSAAVASGDVWRVGSLIGPIYALAILIGGFGRGFGSFVQLSADQTVSGRAVLFAKFNQKLFVRNYDIASGAISNGGNVSNESDCSDAQAQCPVSE